MPTTPSSLGAPARQPRSDKGIVAFHGRHFPRAIFAFPDIKKLNTEGGELFKALEEGKRTIERFSVEELIVYRSFEALTDNEELYDAMWKPEGDETPNEAFERNCIILQESAKQARGDDTHLLKLCLPDILAEVHGDFVPPLERFDRAARGFNHPLTGYLLCPIGRDWFHEPTQKALKRFDLKLGGSRWPNVLVGQRPYTFDPAHPLAHVGKSEEFVLAFKLIFTTRSSAFAANGKGHASGRHGNASIHGMTSVTPASIAYVGMQLYFALTSAAVFNAEDPVWRPHALYLSLLTTLTAPELKSDVDELIQWLNERVFPWGPQAVLGAEDSDDEQGPCFLINQVIAGRKTSYAPEESNNPASGNTNTFTPGEMNVSTPSETNTSTPSDANTSTPGDTNTSTAGDTNTSTPGDTNASSSSSSGLNLRVQRTSKKRGSDLYKSAVTKKKARAGRK